MPLLDPVRSDPRFQAVLRRMNFPEAKGFDPPDLSAAKALLEKTS